MQDWWQREYNHNNYYVESRSDCFLFEFYVVSCHDILLIGDDLIIHSICKLSRFFSSDLLCSDTLVLRHLFMQSSNFLGSTQKLTSQFCRMVQNTWPRKQIVHLYFSLSLWWGMSRLCLQFKHHQYNTNEDPQFDQHWRSSF